MAHSQIPIAFRSLFVTPILMILAYIGNVNASDEFPSNAPSGSNSPSSGEQTISPDVTVDIVETPEGVYYIQSGSLPILPPGYAGRGSGGFISRIVMGVTDENEYYFGLYDNSGRGSQDYRIPDSQVSYDFAPCVTPGVKNTRATNGTSKELHVRTGPGLNEIDLPWGYAPGQDLSATAFFAGRTLDFLGLVDTSTCFWKYDTDGDGTLDASIAWNIYVESAAPSLYPSLSLSPSSSPSSSNKPSSLPSVAPTLSEIPTNPNLFRKKSKSEKSNSSKKKMTKAPNSK